MADKTPETNVISYDERLRQKLDDLIAIAGEQAREIKHLRNQLKALEAEG